MAESNICAYCYEAQIDSNRDLPVCSEICEKGYRDMFSKFKPTSTKPNLSEIFPKEIQEKNYRYRAYEIDSDELLTSATTLESLCIRVLEIWQTPHDFIIEACEYRHPNFYPLARACVRLSLNVERIGEVEYLKEGRPK